MDFFDMSLRVLMQNRECPPRRPALPLTARPPMPMGETPLWLDQMMKKCIPTQSRGERNLQRDTRVKVKALTSPRPSQIAPSQQ